MFDLVTAWIERYRRQAEQRYRRLDAVLPDMPDPSPAIQSPPNQRKPS